MYSNKKLTIPDFLANMSLMKELLADPSDFSRLKAGVCNASAPQILELEDFLRHFVAQQFVEMALARRTKAVTETRTCPHCFGDDVVRHGKDENNRQRFKCRGCKRTYNILTGTPMARARNPEKWAAYLNFMTQHNSVRAIRMAGIGLNHVTIWRWRHRFLKAAANDNIAVLFGVIEVKTLMFRQSFKGCRKRIKATLSEVPVDRRSRKRWSSRPISVLTAVDSSGGVVQAILSLLRTVEMVLDGRIAAGSVLCFEDHAAYVRVADKAEAEPWVIASTPITSDMMSKNPIAPRVRIKARLGLRRVQSYHRTLRHLVNERCRGVATRYLGNYLGWNQAMFQSGFEGTALLTRALA